MNIFIGIFNGYNIELGVFLKKKTVELWIITRSQTMD